MIVADTNLILYLYLEGEYTKNAEAVLNSDPVWAAPLLWKSEFRNALTLYLRKNIISYNTALDFVDQAEKLIDGNEYTIPSSPVLQLTKKSQCSAYDCEFIYLAYELNAPLVTADKKILTEFPKLCMPLSEFSITN